jgi:threonine synthase
MTAYFKTVVCLECGHEREVDAESASCPQCGSGWQDARYDYDRVAELWPEAVAKRDHSLWRYRELLPLEGPNPEITLEEGFTPLVRLYQYETRFNHTHIYLKDERHQPTNSFKDRQAALSVTAMKRDGVTECVLASTGNAAVAYAAYCARAGIKLWLFLTSLVPAEKMREAALYGAEVVKVSGTYDETKRVAAEFAKRKGIPMDHGAKTIPAKESMKTIAFEIAEQLGLKLQPETGKWVAPDWYIQAVSGGIGPLGVWKGFDELHRMGMIDHMPKLGIIQAAGCAPMVTAFEQNLRKAEPVIPKTLIHVLATGDPGFGYTQIYDAIKRDGGAILAVEDGDAFKAMRHLASRAGISVEPATAVAFAGLERMLTEGLIAPDEVVVVNCTGHTMPAESHILGDQYDRYILNLNLNPEHEESGVQEEGLGAALLNLDEQVTTIVVVDDNPNDRRLIRRLLQSHKHYRVYEAQDGAEGIQVIKDRMPDLVVCDLTMPEMDGFGLLQHIKNDPETAHIPMVVVSAKSLTAHDRDVLDAYSDSVWTKGGFETRELVDHVVHRLGHTPLGVIKSERRERVVETAAPVISGDAAHTVVIIDDNDQDRRLTRRMLETGGQGAFHVIEAATGRDGLRAVYSYHPDLIVLDLMLPDLDGFSILDTLQSDPKLRAIPVVIVSAKELVGEEYERLHESIHQTLEKASLDRRQFLDIIKGELSIN